MDILNTLLPTILPELQTLIGLLLTALISWIAYQVKQRFGVDVQIKKVEEAALLRDLLTQALTNGAKAAIQSTAYATDGEKANAAVDYVEKSIPQTLLKLGAPRDVLKQRALAILFDLAWDQILRARN